MSELPKRLLEIVEEFAICEGQEKLQHLLYYAEQLEPLPDWLSDRRDEMEEVHECMTPVYIHAERRRDGLDFYFDVPAESPTVRGFASFLSQGTGGATPEEVLAIPANFFLATGLNQVLSVQRMSGLSSILAHMKRLAAGQLSA